MAFPSPPPAPQRGDRTTFSSRVDAFLTWLTNLVPMLNTFLSSITALAAGGANTYVFAFDTSTVEANPGVGKFRLNSATQNAATIMRINPAAGNGGDLSPLFGVLNSGTSNIKASVRIQKVGDVNSYLVYDITAIAGATTYWNLTIVPRTGSATSPFAANDTVAIFFDAKGDKGDGGGTPTQQQIRDAIGTLGIGNGGTSATTAPAALAALGAFPSAGGNITGNAVFNNGTGLFFRDSAGNARQVLVFASDNNTYVNMGPGGFTNFQNAAGTATIFTINNSGGITPSGGLVLKNNVPIYGTNADGTVRALQYIDGSNWLNNFGGLSGTRWWNSIGSAVLASLSDSGAFSANTVTETSDERKKTNWRELTDVQLDALADLQKVGVFDWIDGTGSGVGASAQAIRAIVPEAVHEDAEGNLSVAYGGLSFAMAQGALRRAKGAS